MMQFISWSIFVILYFLFKANAPQKKTLYYYDGDFSATLRLFVVLNMVNLYFCGVT